MIEGFSIGHHTARGDGWLTGTTVVLARDGAVGGIDVRGGGPGTRETDLLSPTAMVHDIHAVVLTGGSAYGLAAADGVMHGLGERGIGFPVPTPQADPPTAVVPIVPAAVIFDLGRGGVTAHRPDAGFGARALAAALAADLDPDGRPAVGSVGAGTGAVCGGLRGGFGYAERTAGPYRVGAALVLNASGPAVDVRTGRPWADTLHTLPAPRSDQRAAIAEALSRVPSFPLNTTIATVLTDAPLDRMAATKTAQVAHDGLARAVRPVHRMMDGDTIFCLASARVDAAPDPRGLFDVLLTAAADVVEEACLGALLAATTAGPWPAYADLVPEVRRPPQ
ncbi:P1 family peptidase [Raineyella sp. LH-20]|uniref:P1 family peptidase n=1 Tax=Raineyella sp. LH-20 TaxID=3081204 RepID=UPI0029553406|nr:P1 family peptidase [Raineyella sp. LH-20]WOP17894.1 P1 family peptidase [Raineyella sp. LH-20]